MLSPEAGKLWLRVALFFLIASGALLFFVKPDTPEFVVTVLSFIMGLLFTAIVVVAVVRSNR